MQGKVKGIRFYPEEFNNAKKWIEDFKIKNKSCAKYEQPIISINEIRSQEEFLNKRLK